MQLSIKINISQLRADIRDLAQQSRRLKQTLRQPWTAPMGDVQSKLVCARRRTTRLLVLRAFARGKLHLQSLPREFSIPGTGKYFEQLDEGEIMRLLTWDRVESQRRIAEYHAQKYALAPDLPIVAGSSAPSAEAR